MQKNKNIIKFLVFAHYTVQDPPTANTIVSLLKLGHSVLVIQQSVIRNYELEKFKNFKLIRLYNFEFFNFLFALKTLFKWIYYKFFVKLFVLFYKPDYILGFMLHYLSALNPSVSKKFKLLSCIYDIPSIEYSGRLDKRILKAGWQRLRFADLIWSSDKYKAELAQKFGHLETLPIVCHNCPATDYFHTDLWPRDKWLRLKLEQQGAQISENTCILIRAGAIGPYGGIEETLQSLKSLPTNIIFFMMGRPDEDYKNSIIRLINDLNLSKRAFLWVQPDDNIWKKALLGADIGQLIHLRPASGSIAANYDLNSSLSNNRLFQYMAAGLPIISYNDPRMNLIYDEVDCFKVVDVENFFASLIKNINCLAKNEQERIRLGKNGREVHLKKYNWEYQFEPVLNKIITK